MFAGRLSRGGISASFSSQPSCRFHNSAASGLADGGGRTGSRRQKRRWQRQRQLTRLQAALVRQTGADLFQLARPSRYERASELREEGENAHASRKSGAGCLPAGRQASERTRFMASVGPETAATPATLLQWQPQLRRRQRRHRTDCAGSSGGAASASHRGRCRSPAAAG